MTRNLKALGLSFLAMLAVSAVASSAAHAAPGELHSEVAAGKTSAILTGTPVDFIEHEGSFKSLPFRCENATFEGTVQKATTDATVTPQYTSCKLAGGPAEIKMNGCKYTFTGVADFTANVDIVGCTAGKAIEFVSLTCVVKVPEQKNLSHVVFSNTAGSPKDIHASMTLTGITYEATPKIMTGCTGVSGHHADGTFSSVTTVRAYEDSGLNPLVTVGGHCYQPFKEGAQVGLFST